MAGSEVGAVAEERVSLAGIIVLEVIEGKLADDAGEPVDANGRSEDEVDIPVAVRLEDTTGEETPVADDMLLTADGSKKLSEGNSDIEDFAVGATAGEVSGSAEMVFEGRIAPVPTKPELETPPTTEDVGATEVTMLDNVSDTGMPLLGIGEEMVSVNVIDAEIPVGNAVEEVIVGSAGKMLMPEGRTEEALLITELRIELTSLEGMRVGAGVGSPEVTP